MFHLILDHLSEVVKHRNVTREMSSMSEHISLVALRCPEQFGCLTVRAYFNTQKYGLFCSLTTYRTDRIDSKWWRFRTSFPGFSHEVTWVNGCPNRHKASASCSKSVHFGNNDDMPFSYRASSQRLDPGLRNLSEWRIFISHPIALTRKIRSGHVWVKKG